MRVSLTEFDTEQVNYDTLTRLLQEYQETRSQPVKESILDWAANHSDLHTRLVTSMMANIDQHQLTTIITYDMVQRTLDDLKQYVVVNKVARFAADNDINLLLVYNINLKLQSLFRRN